MWPTREEAYKLLKKYTKNRNLIKHALAVEAAMRAYAPRFDGDVEKWGIVGLIHDFEYDRYPDEHPAKGTEILRELEMPAELIRGVQAHAPYLTGVTPETPLEKAIYAVDELTGLIVAVALVRPTRSIYDVEVSSVEKKWGSSAFAAGVKREDIEEGAEMLGVPLPEHIGIVLAAMQGIADALGLAGKKS
ncbi:MAG: HAD family hydrolase [Anaerolineae bacterium]|nr:HAD family hydrolase [Anaerolineae bacterium]